MYAVGALAYSLVTGQHVFAGKSGAEVIGHHLHSKPQSPSERLGRTLDPFLEGLILACLSKRPEDRPADAGALLEQLEQGWTGAAWTQRDAREWWQTRAPAMLATRRAVEATRLPRPEPRGGRRQPHAQQPLRPLARGRGYEDLHAAADREALTP